jgi:hypothetical protein
MLEAQDPEGKLLVPIVTVVLLIWLKARKQNQPDLTLFWG